MSVIKVTELWKGQASVNQGHEKQSVRTFEVKFNSSDTPAARPVLALTATDGTTSIPAYGAVHPGSSIQFVREKSVSETVSPLIFRVTVIYRNAAGFTSRKEPDDNVNPLSRDTEISYSFADEDVQIDEDIDGNAITNSAGETPDPPITKTVSDLLIEVVNNESSFSATTAMNYKNKVNSSSFMGFAAGLVKCEDYSGTKMYDSVYGEYWQVRKVFRVRYASVGGVNKGWKKRLLDQGFRETDGTDDAGKPKYKAITAADDDGKLIPVSEPVLLNGSGAKLADAGTPVWLEYDVYDEASFSGLV